MRTLCSGRCTGRGVGTSGLPTVDLQMEIPERGACRLDLSRALPEILAVDNDGQAGGSVKTVEVVAQAARTSALRVSATRASPFGVVRFFSMGSVSLMRARPQDRIESVSPATARTKRSTSDSSL